MRYYRIDKTFIRCLFPTCLDARDQFIARIERLQPAAKREEMRKRL